MTSEAQKSFYQTHPETCAPDDYWGQVRRTLNGKPIPERQIELIDEGIAAALALGRSELLLDLCCGNGALTTRWFARCAGGVGVDFSAPLIDVARRVFTRGTHERYVLASVLDYAADPARFGEAGPFDKAVCYGSLQYLPRADVRALLGSLRRSFPTLRRFVIGNVPDRDRVAAFRRDGAEVALDDPASAIGCWWSVDELAAAAADSGFTLTARRMPDEFYAAHYRFDAVLVPRDQP